MAKGVYQDIFKKLSMAEFERNKLLLLGIETKHGWPLKTGWQCKSPANKTRFVIDRLSRDKPISLGDYEKIAEKFCYRYSNNPSHTLRAVMPLARMTRIIISFECVYSKGFWVNPKSKGEHDRYAYQIYERSL